jgi:3'-5' exoribonuclease
MLADVTDGMSVRTQAYLKQKRLIPYKNKPGAFLALTLADRSGVLEGKVFDNAEEIAGHLPDGAIVTVTGRASTYQNALGLILESVEVCANPVDRADFMPAYAGDVRELTAELDAAINSITDPDLGPLVRSLLHDPEIGDLYRAAPAGKSMHGAYLHGLMEHVVRMVRLAEAVCRCYPQADRDLLIAGVLLHDLGKIREYQWDLSIDQTTLGRLQGHILIGDRMIYERGRELGMAEERALRLSHLILSHHGQSEYGAVTAPQTLEAVLLHYLDNLEAKATHCLEMLASGGETPWTEYDRVEGHYWYRGTPEAARPGV